MLRDPRSGFILAASKHDHFGPRLFRSVDDGRTFEPTGLPTYPPKPEGTKDVEPMGGREVPWALKSIWCLETGHASEPGVLWCGTLPGGLFKSTDDGATWELNRPLWDHPKRQDWFGGGAEFPAIHSICVHPLDGQRISIAVSCAGIWHTTDGGQSWALACKGMRAEYMPPEQAFAEESQDPHRMVQCAGSPNRMWVQHHNGIFRSDDCGHSWTEMGKLGPSNFGFGVVVHPKDPDRAWFVPGIKDEMRIPVDGQLVVTRTRDGGKTADVLSRGLPGPHAYDLVYRNALDIDATGERLAFGSTTGSLFVSENSGDDWVEISSHLPPIYAVRFA